MAIYKVVGPVSLPELSSSSSFLVFLSYALRLKSVRSGGCSLPDPALCARTYSSPPLPQLDMPAGSPTSQPFYSVPKTWVPVPP